jgi:hypothetical protein
MLKRFLIATLVVLSSVCHNGPAAAGNKTVTFHKKTIIDRQGFGMEAFRLLIPDGWRFKGGISWNTAKFPAEASTAWTVTSPDGLSRLEQLPHTTFFWSEEPSLQQSYAQGGAIIQAPMDAASYLRNIFLPRYRPQASQMKILASGPLPELARETRSLTEYHMGIFNQISPFQFRFDLQADAGHIKVSYQMNGRRIIEDITASICYMTAYFPGMYGYVTGTTWIPRVKSFSAPAGRMEQQARLFRIMVDSYRENPEWEVANTRLAASITRDQLRQQQAIFNRMQQIRNSQQEVDDMIMAGYQRRSAAQDRIFEHYSEAVRGVDSYRDPVNDWQVELPTGMNNAWTNGSEYVFSENADFNPNIGSNQNWQPMQHMR